MLSIVTVITQIQTKAKCFCNLVVSAHWEKEEGSRSWSSLQGLLACFMGCKQISENRLKLHRYKTNCLSKEYLQTALCFPVVHRAWICSLCCGVWTTGIKSIAFLFWLGCLGFFFIEAVTDCFNSASVCLLKTSWISTWIDTVRKNYALYHLPAAQKIGHIATLSLVRIQRLILRNVNHISTSFSS